MGKVFSWIGIAALSLVAIVATAGAASPAIAAALGLGGVSAGVLGLASTASLVGAQYLLKTTQSTTPAGSNLPSFSAPQSGPSPTPLYRTIRQAEVPRCFIFGRTKTSGGFFFYESDTVAVTGNAPTTNADSRIGKFVYTGIYLCDGPIDGFDGVVCDDEAFSAGSTGVNRVSNTPDGNDNVFIPRDGIKFVKSPNYSSTSAGVAINPYNGLPYTYPVTSSGTYTIKDCALIAFEPVNGTEAGYRSYILNNLMVSYSNAAMSGTWSANHLGKGITCLYTYASTTAIPAGTSRIKYFPNGFPEWSVILRGVRMYDPRDPSQSLLDPVTGKWTIYNTTWKWSENPALVAAHFIMWLIDQKVTAITGVDWDAIYKAADDCDALSKTAYWLYPDRDTYEPFARVSGVFYFNTPPREFLANIMAACDASYGLDRQGRFSMWVGKWENPAVTFTESDIGGFTEEFVESASEAMNEVHVSYTEPRQNYQSFEAPVWKDEASQNLVGKRIQSLKLPLVPSPNQAFRIVQRMARRINGKKKITLTVGPRGMLAIKQRVVGIGAPTFGISGVWRIEALQPDVTLARWTMTLREITPDVFADDPPPNDPITQLKIVNLKSLSAPTYFLATAQTTKPGFGYAIVSANVNITQPNVQAATIIEDGLIQEQTLQLDADYSLDGGTNWSRMTIFLADNIIRTPELPSGTSVTLACRYVALNSTVSAWSSNKTVTIP